MPADARDRAYAAADMIEFPGKQLRRDIALRAVRRPVSEPSEPEPAPLVPGPRTERPRRPDEPAPGPASRGDPMAETAAEIEEIDVDAPARRDRDGLQERSAGDGEGRARS